MKQALLQDLEKAEGEKSHHKKEGLKIKCFCDNSEMNFP